MGQSTFEEESATSSPPSEDEGSNPQLVVPGRVRYPTPLRSRTSLVPGKDAGNSSGEDAKNDLKSGPCPPGLGSLTVTRLTFDPPHRAPISGLSPPRTPAEEEFWAYTEELRREADRRLTATTESARSSGLSVQVGSSGAPVSPPGGSEPPGLTSGSSEKSESATAVGDAESDARGQKRKRAQSPDALSSFPPSNASTKYPQSAETGRSPSPPVFKPISPRPIIGPYDGTRDSIDDIDVEAQGNVAIVQEKTKKRVAFCLSPKPEYPQTNTKGFKRFLRFAYLTRSVWNVAFFITQVPTFLAIWIIWGTVGRFPNASDAKHGQFAMEFCLLVGATFAFVVLFISRIAPRCAWSRKEYDVWLMGSNMRKELICELLVIASFASVLGLRAVIWNQDPSIPWCLNGFLEKTQNVPEGDDEKKAAAEIMAKILARWTVWGETCRDFVAVIVLVAWQVAFWSSSLLFRWVELYLGACLRASKN